MNRIREYTGFAIGYLGLGYIVLWPLSGADHSGQPFGASLVCGDTSWLLLDFICHSEHRLQMSPSLHALGLMSTSLVTLRVLFYALKRTRRAVIPPAVDISMMLARLPKMNSPPRRTRPPAQRAVVKPRAQFGLRGVPP